MTAVSSARAGLTPLVGTAGQGQRAGQAAFFRAALGQAQSAPAAAETKPPMPQAVVQEPVAKTPSPYLRPGSLLDIRI